MEDVSREDFVAWWESKTGCAVDDTTREEIKQAYDNRQLSVDEDVTKEYVDNQITFHEGANPAPDSLMLFQSNSNNEPNTLTILSDGEMCVELNLKTGGMEYGEHYVPSDTAKIFWDAVQNNSPAMLHMEIKNLKSQLAFFRFKYGEGTAAAPDHCHGDNGKVLPETLAEMWKVAAQAHDTIRNGGWEENKEDQIQISNDASHLYHLQDEGMNVNDWASYYSDHPEEQIQIQMFYEDQRHEQSECAIIVENGPVENTSVSESAYERAMKVVE